MNYTISAEAKYSCERCGKTYAIEGDDIDFSAESSSERQMGNETQYCAEYDHNCVECGNEIRIEFEAWVYPEGVFNQEIVSAHGAKLIGKKIGLKHLPDIDPVIEAAMLFKPLFQFRFDKFSEQLVDLWIGLYKRNHRATLGVTYALFTTLLISLVVVGYLDSRSRSIPIRGGDDITDQIELLRETEKNLENLGVFIAGKQAEILTTQEVLSGLEQRRAEIEPLVKANQDVVNAMFSYQQRELQATAWKERGIGFALGVLSSLIASIIWHFIGRSRSGSSAGKI